MKKQLLILEALGKEYVNVSLINVKRETVSILKTDFGTQMFKEEIPEIPYFEICRKSIDKYVEEDKKAPLLEMIKLENVVKELAEKGEYTFTYETIVENQTRICQMKYMKLNDPDHILMAFRFVDETEAPGLREKVRRSADELRKERLFLEVLCRDYTSVYYLDLNSDTLEILKLNSDANVARMIGNELRKELDYTDAMQKYCSRYVWKKIREISGK